MVKTSEIFKKVEEIAKNNPDMTYPDRMMDMGVKNTDNLPCLYVYNGQPACIMGMALNELGVPIETLDKFDADGNTIRKVAEFYPDIVEDDGYLNHLYSIQKLQDVGYEFERAVERVTSE